MRLHRLLAKALASPSPLPQHHRLRHPRILLQSSIYTTTPKGWGKSSKTQEKSEKPEPSIPVPKEKEWDRPLNDLNAIEASSISRQAKKEWPRPSEIPWQAKVANSVNLIGYVALPVQFQVSDDGKCWAGTILSQNKVPEAPLWIPIIFEDDLAHIAACHLKEKDFVHVAGQLTGDPPQFTMEQGQPSVQVMAHSLNFVHEALQGKESSTSKKKKEVTSISSEGSITKHLWIDLLANPHDWWDNRLNKSNRMDPDFKHKDSGELWIDDSTQAWIISKLETLNFINKTTQKNQNSANGVKDLESSWRDLVDNPNQWWDNRKDKLNGRVHSKSPDFKNKDSGVALWLGSAPEWVLFKFKELKSDKTASKTSQQKDNKENSWKDLVENPDRWWDNRSDKVNPKSPDFKRKDTGEGLWLDSSPAWVLPKLRPVKSKVAAVGKRETLLS